jgi:CRP-like cAMP-binding protein
MAATLSDVLSNYFGISVAESEKLSSCFKMEKLKKGDYFLRYGRYADRLSFMEDGLMRIFAARAEKEVTQWIATSGYFVTDLYAFLFEQTARWNIQALTDCSIATISKDKYRCLNQLIPRWNEYEKLFLGKCFVTLENRVFDFLSLSAEQRYYKLFDSNRELLNTVPLQYLASMLGMTPETLSRIRAKKIS